MPIHNVSVSYPQKWLLCVPLSNIFDYVVKPFRFIIASHPRILCSRHPFTALQITTKWKLDSFNILSFCFAFSSFFSFGISGSFSGLKTSIRKFSTYSKYWQTSECFVWLYGTIGIPTIHDFFDISFEYLFDEMRRNRNQ